MKNFTKTVIFFICIVVQVSLARNGSDFYQLQETHKTSPSLLDIHFASYFHLRYSCVPHGLNNKVNEDHWSLRRFKLITEWKLNHGFQFFSQLIYKTNNYSDTDDKIYLQHAFLKLFFDKHLNFKIGQFKPPYGWERFQPDFRLPEVERSLVSYRLIPNGSLGESFARDYGLQLYGTLFSDFQYETALMSGGGAHTELSYKNFPLIVGRLIFNKKFQDPLIQKNIRLFIQLAFSQRWNKDNNFTKQLPGCEKNIFQHFNGRDKRYDVAVSFNAKRSCFAMEYLSAEFQPNEGVLNKNSASGWFVKYSCFFSDHWQYAVRYEQYNPDHAKRDIHDLTCFTTGLDYYFNEKNGRIMVDYILKNEVTTKSNDDMIVLQMQYFLFGEI